MKLIAGPSSPLLTKKIAEKTGFEIAETVYKRFPDGELYVMVRGDDDSYAVVNSLKSNEDIVYLMLIFDALEGKSITAVIPYMGYARQDRAFLKGEAVSIRAVAKLIEEYADRVITVNIHSERARGHFRKLTELDAMKVIGQHYRGRDIVMLSPDRGSLSRVKRAAEIAECEFDYLDKRRIDAENVEMVPKNLDIEGKEIAIVDDIISTGGTVITAAAQLSGKAKKIEAACVHGVFAGNALNRLFLSGISQVKSTDTIETQVSVLSISEIISEVLLDEV